MEQAVFLFPGQGAQSPGMGKDLYEHFGTAKRIFDGHASVRDICFNASDEELKQTKLTQPAIYLHSVIIDMILKENGLRPLAAAGHSLGEYSALTSAGVMDIKTGIALVTERGRLMQDSGNEVPGTMAAIIGLDDEKVKEICAKQQGVVEAVNFNAPGQVVISGAKDAVMNSLAVFEAEGAAMAKPLNVSGAFHSSLLKNAADKFKAFLQKFTFQALSIGVIANVKADYYKGPEEVIGLLSQQICAPVLWTDSARRFISEGKKTFIEVGPGNVLKGLMRRIDKTALVETTSDAKGLQAIIDKFKN